MVDYTVYFQLWRIALCIFSCGRLYCVFSAVMDCIVYFQLWRIVLCIFSCDRLYCVFCVFSAVADCIVYFQLWWIVLCIFSCDGLYCVFSAVTDCTVYFQLHQWQREKQQQLPRRWCLLVVMMCLWPQVWMAQQGVTVPPWCKFSDLLPTGVWVSSGCKITWCPQDCGSVLAVRLPGAHTQSVAE